MEVLQISLAAARVNAGYTQSEVAKKMGVTKQTVVNWEKGITEPKLLQGRKLSELYRIPLDNIFCHINQIKGEMQNEKMDRKIQL